VRFRLLLVGNLGRFTKLEKLSIKIEEDTSVTDFDVAITRLRLDGFARAIAQTRSLKEFSMTISSQAVNPDVAKIIGALKGNHGLRSVNIVIE
jgi:hypothetical protein